MYKICTFDVGRYRRRRCRIDALISSFDDHFNSYTFQMLIEYGFDLILMNFFYCVSLDECSNLGALFPLNSDEK